MPRYFTKHYVASPLLILAVSLFPLVQSVNVTHADDSAEPPAVEIIAEPVAVDVSVASSSGDFSLPVQTVQTTVQTKDVHVYANVVNVVDTNLTDSDITKLFQNFNTLSNNLVLDNPDSTSRQISEKLTDQLCDQSVCEGIESYKFSQPTSDDVATTVDLSANTGNNTVGDSEPGSQITTGDAHAVVNILNIVGSDLANSHISITAINVFGDWKGDLVLPSKLYFNKIFASVVSNTGADQTASISNSITIDAISGDNGIIASTSDGSSITTGDASTAANIHTITNQSLANGEWYLGMVQTLGPWSGDIFSLPDQVRVQKTLNGLVFSSSTESMPASYSLESVQTSIVNDIKIRANSGGNSIEGPTVQSDSIVTGTSSAVANILNFANLNLINTNMNIGIVTVFGSWDGNIVFGDYEKTLTDKIPDDASTVAFEKGAPLRQLRSYINVVEPDPNQLHPTNLISLIKTNDAPVDGVRAHDFVTFSLSVHNTSIFDFTEVLVHDTMKNTDGDVVFEQTFPIEGLAMRELVVIKYDMEIPDTIPPGVYTNSAYATATDPFNIRKLISEQTVQSTFSVRGDEPLPMIHGEVLSETVPAKTVHAYKKPSTKSAIIPMVEASGIIMPISSRKSVWGMELDSLGRISFLLLFIATAYVIANRHSRNKKKQHLTNVP